MSEDPSKELALGSSIYASQIIEVSYENWGHMRAERCFAGGSRGRQILGEELRFEKPFSPRTLIQEPLEGWSPTFLGVDSLLIVIYVA